MRFDRRAAGALAAGAFLVAGGGAALAASGKGDASATCDQRLAKAAEQRGVSVDQLKAEIQARLLARIDAARRRDASPRSARRRSATASTRGASAALAGMCGHGWPGTACCAVRRHSSASTGSSSACSSRGTRSPISPLAQGKSEPDLETAMLAPAKARLAKAVAAWKVTQARADTAIDRLEKLASRIATREFRPSPSFRLPPDQGPLWRGPSSFVAMPGV